MSVIDERIQQVVAFAKSGNKSEARRLLEQIIRDEPGETRAWFLLSQLVDTRDQAIQCMQRVLELEPENAQARRKLQEFQAMSGRNTVVNAAPGQESKAPQKAK